MCACMWAKTKEHGELVRTLGTLLRLSLTCIKDSCELDLEGWQDTVHQGPWTAGSNRQEVERHNQLEDCRLEAVLWVDRRGQISEQCFLYDWVSGVFHIPPPVCLQSDNSRELSMPFWELWLFFSGIKWRFYKWWFLTLESEMVPTNFWSILSFECIFYITCMSLCHHKWITWKITTHC